MESHGTELDEVEKLGSQFLGCAKVSFIVIQCTHLRGSEKGWGGGGEGGQGGERERGMGREKEKEAEGEGDGMGRKVMRGGGGEGREGKEERGRQEKSGLILPGL